MNMAATTTHVRTGSSLRWRLMCCAVVLVVSVLAPSQRAAASPAIGEQPSTQAATCVDGADVCVSDLAAPVVGCDQDEQSSRVLVIYAYPNASNRVITVRPYLEYQTQWIDGEFDRAAGPRRDQDVRWRRSDGLVLTGSSVLICPVSVPDRENDGYSWQELRQAAIDHGHDRWDRRYVIWYDGAVRDFPVASYDKYAWSPTPNGYHETGNLHELIHILGAPHTIETNDYMQDYTGDMSTDLCGPERTIDCNKNEFYSTYCAVNFCSLPGYNIATSPFLTWPTNNSYSASCRGVPASFGDEDADDYPGGSSAEAFQGWEGNDTIGGGGGNDVLCGHWGIDRVDGQAGADQVDGGWGDDEVFGGDGDDRVWGGGSDDALFDGAGADTIDGGDGSDVFNDCLDNTTETVANVEYHFISTNYCTPIGRGTHILGPGQRLLPGQALFSTDRRYTLEMQTDGNLVLYKPGRAAVWWTNTYTPGAYLIMQTDGHLVMYNPAGGSVLWQSWTWGNNGSILTLQTDCNLVIYRQDGSASWATGTNGC